MFDNFINDRLFKDRLSLRIHFLLFLQVSDNGSNAIEIWSVIRSDAGK